MTNKERQIEVGLSLLSRLVEAFEKQATQLEYIAQAADETNARERAKEMERG